MDFTCQVSFYDEIHSTIVKEHQLLMHKKNKTEYLFSRIQVQLSVPDPRKLKNANFKDLTPTNQEWCYANN